jgi:phage/plasmid-associated DNA primase
MKETKETKETKKTNKMKKTKKARPAYAPTGDAVNQLKTAIFKFVETPRHTTEVLKALQHGLETDFSVSRDKYHLLPCANGVVNLKTGVLLCAASPDDFFTHASATKYDPDVDISPAQAFYKDFFPPEANGGEEQQEALVRFMQQWNGYCLTLETNMELCVWFHGPGSNGKSLMVELLECVLGKVEDGGVHSSLPIASLCKERGANNGALFDAKDARHVTVSEMDKKAMLSEAALRALVSGESQHLKQMWQKERKVKPRLKLSMFVNYLPAWDDPRAHCTKRRNIYVPMPKIFVDENDARDKIQIDEYRAKGRMDCLIAPKNRFHLQDNILPHATAFLRFWVLGAVEFYKHREIEIPRVLQEHQVRELSDRAEIVENYVEEHLELAANAKLLQRDILDDFRRTTQMDELSFKAHDFFKVLEKAISEKGPEWSFQNGVRKYNGRDGSVRKGPDGKDLGKGMLWSGLTFKDAAKAPWNGMKVVTHDRYTADMQPFH